MRNALAYNHDAGKSASNKHYKAKKARELQEADELETDFEIQEYLTGLGYGRNDAENDN